MILSSMRALALASLALLDVLFRGKTLRVQATGPRDAGLDARCQWESWKGEGARDAMVDMVDSCSSLGGSSSTASKLQAGKGAE